MSEKDGIEKLIELMNKHLFEKGEKIIIKTYDTYSNPSGTFRGINLTRTEWPDHFVRGFELITKQYGFIKWLCDKNKIDFDKTGYKKADFQEVWNGDWRTVRGYEMLLMLLAIQERPVEFLISILK